MNIENPKLAIARVAEAMKHSYRCEHPRSHAGMDNLIVEPEFSLAFEDVEGIGMILVDVRVDAHPRAEAQVNYLELWHLGENSVVSRTPSELLALVGTDTEFGHAAKYPD